ncbi:MAG: hypothetical protein EBR81_15125 [Proteobacteria bacterium]|nr:hypothetical protein [Pseudomonadota bacterium]
MPGQERDDYVWAPTMRLFDTAMPGALTKQLTKEQKIAYLAGLAEHLPEYQSPSYLIPALGWFCACPLTALLRHDARLGKGHPTLLITGPKGSGKSTFAAQVLGPHFGCRAARSLAKGATSIFAVKRGLGATNVCPYIGDEFRDEDPVRTTTLGALIRSLWDGEMPSESGTANGEIRIDQLVAPLCIIGESPYTDTANLDRTLCIHVSPAWVQELRQRDRTTFVAAESWLHSDSHHGVLGTLLLDYVNSHMDDVLRTIDAAYARIAATCPTPNERKQKGFVAAYAGLLLLKRVYALYGVPFFLTTKQMLAGIYAADSEVTGTNAGTDPALKQLFRITDSIITNAKRLHASYEGSLYTTRQEDGICYGYFQLSRWFEVVSGAAKISDSAALRNARGFTELLKTDITSEHPCVIDLQSMRGFRREAVEVNLTVMSELYNIDIAAWLETTDY